MISVGAVIIVAVAFLLGSGYVTFAFPFSFAVTPYVKIGINEDKAPVPVFGGYNTTLGVFDVYSKFASERLDLKQIEFKVRLVPKASQDNNGLRNITLNYWSCRPSKGPSYGYSQQTCQYLYKSPVSVRSVAENTIVTFADMNLPVYSSATRQGFTLNANMAFTGRMSVGNRTPEISVRINEAKEVLITEPGSNTPINTRFGKRESAWLRILAGYGYPMRYNQLGAPVGQVVGQ
ncbi:MAG: hypothetical protein EXS68_02855 [Candidatus Ryanbacteria bacterium]|nr:hypothetical protein [Candidatus Ryanbacteria bacterium]